ncbi:MAG: hypothetical protein VXZ84_08995, partial [Planctomycetota bacterium]|nr:hypothetical protein [Planctomycetota bacterium]
MPSLSLYDFLPTVIGLYYSKLACRCSNDSSGSIIGYVMLLSDRQSASWCQRYSLCIQKWSGIWP